VSKRCLTIKKQIRFLSSAPWHFSSSSLAAQSGQLLAAILSKIMFLVKQPSVACRVLNSDLCPPHDLLHDIESYPIFYDALYYPQYHLCVFSTPENFYSWLQLCISSHRELCSTCSPLFQTTSVVHDGLALCVRVDDVAMTFARSHFESAMYSHCSIFKHFQGASPLTVASCRASRVDEYKVNLLALSRPELIAAACLIADRKSVTRNKDNCVKVILNHFCNQRAMLSEPIQ